MSRGRAARFRARDERRTRTTSSWSAAEAIAPASCAHALAGQAGRGASSTCTGPPSAPSTRRSAESRRGGANADRSGTAASPTSACTCWTRRAAARAARRAGRALHRRRRRGARLPRAPGADGRPLRRRPVRATSPGAPACTRRGRPGPLAARDGNDRIPGPQRRLPR